MTDFSFEAAAIRDAVQEAAMFLSAPHVRMRPRVFPDGNKWCCLYGDDLMNGVAGFGDTPAGACNAFDTAWWSEKPPVAQHGHPIAETLMQNELVEKVKAAIANARSYNGMYFPMS
jgi:hypothetical protein